MGSRICRLQATAGRSSARRGPGPRVEHRGGEVVDIYRAHGGAPANTDLAIDGAGLALLSSGDGTVTSWDPEGARRLGREVRRPATSWSAGTWSARPRRAGALRLPTVRTVTSAACRSRLRER